MDKEKFVKWLKEEIKGCQSRNEVEREQAMNELLVKVERGYFDREVLPREKITDSSKK